MSHALCFLLGAIALKMFQSLWRRRIAWHGEAFRCYWRRISRNPGGRPPVKREIIELIRRLSFENPLWGAPHIHGEILKHGYDVSERTVSRYMIRRKGRTPVPRWRDFLRENADRIVAIDMLTVRTLRFDCLYALVVLGHGRRTLMHVEVAHFPAAQWLANQITEVFPWENPDITLLRDNDGAYGKVFRRRLRAMGIRDKPTWPPRSPWQNGHAERLIGSIRRECLDHTLILNAAHLRYVLRAYADYYNNDRTHLALGKDTPNPRAIESGGAIVSTPILGGLHHRYRRKPVK